MDTTRIVLSGSGGQGVITAAIILGEAAAVHEGLNAVQTQVYGPEARGGATRADVVISQDNIYYPKVINPHILVCLTQKAYNKYAHIVRPGGMVLVDGGLVRVNEKIDARQASLPLFAQLMQELKKPVVFNICVLGALLALSSVIKTESVQQAISDRVPPQVLSLNQEAFQLGLELGREASGR